MGGLGTLTTTIGVLDDGQLGKMDVGMEWRIASDYDCYCEYRIRVSSSISGGWWVVFSNDTIALLMSILIGTDVL